MARCGSCSSTDNLTQANYPDNSTYTLGDGQRTFNGRWQSATFPAVPCGSPQYLYWEYHNGTKFTTIPLQSGGTGPVRINAANPKLANANQWYNRTVSFHTVGTWRLRTRMACGPLFTSPEHTQVVVAPAAAGPPKMIHTQASIL